MHESVARSRDEAEDAGVTEAYPHALADADDSPAEGVVNGLAAETKCNPASRTETMTTRTDRAGRLICQVRGCNEPAAPWAIVIDSDDLEIEVVLCRRHEGALFGVATSAHRTTPDRGAAA